MRWRRGGASALHLPALTVARFPVSIFKQSAVNTWRQGNSGNSGVRRVLETSPAKGAQLLSPPIVADLRSAGVTR